MLHDRIHDVELQFAEAMEAKGYGYHLIPADGAWYNFAAPGDKREKYSAKLNYRKKLEGVVKAFHLNGGKPLYIWPSDGEHIDLSDADREALKTKQAKQETEEKERRDKAIKDAFKLFYNELPNKPPPPKHPYLVKKGIKDATPARYEKKSKALVVPVFNIKTHELQTIERIYENGDKYVPEDATTPFGVVIPGCSHMLDELKKVGKHQNIYECEGFATGYSIGCAVHQTVICARSCTNLVNVAKAIREQKSLSPIIVCGDNNPAGRLQAIEAARIFLGKVVFPKEQYDDFNDMFLAEGAEAVYKWIHDNAKEPAPEVKQIVLDPLDPLPSARVMIAECYTTPDKLRIFHRHRGTFLKWNGACYKIHDDEIVHSEIWQFLEKAFTRNNKDKLVPFKPTSKRVTEIYNALCAALQLNNKINSPFWLSEDPAMPPATEFFACGNGLLHLPTRKLYPPTPEYFGTTASEVRYDPNAPQPKKWLKFLKETIVDDEAIQAEQEWDGYTLSLDTSQQKILLRVGPTRCGKGTIARIKRMLVGVELVDNPTISFIGTTFGLESLITKSLAIISDMRIGSKTDKASVTERLLSISGEDAVNANRKFKGPWNGKLATRVEIITNELPSVPDSSGAFVGRLLVIVFQNSFYGKEDPGLTNKLIPELSGILNWAIDGYDRMRARGHFVQPKNAKDQIDMMMALGSPIRAFIRDRCVLGPKHEELSDMLWREYQIWCTQEGKTNAGTKEWFFRQLHSAVPGLELTRPSFEFKLRDPKTNVETTVKKQVPTYKGIRLKIGEEA